MRKRLSWNWFIFKLWIFGSKYREIKIQPVSIKNNLTFKTPSKNDIDSFIKLASLHADKGHYHLPNIETDVRISDSLKEQFAHSIYLQLMRFPSGVSKAYVVAAYAGSEPVAYCWMRSIPESDHNAWEIFMLSVQPSYQREGIAEQLSQFCISHLPDNTAIYARVFKSPDSMGIRKLLKKLGFSMMRELKAAKTDTFIKPGNYTGA